uniref:Leucine rich repeat containing 9 n=1 Tax=Callorhinchus milii TaxID=7868 RepID=A0A4W3GU67_CALMI
MFFSGYSQMVGLLYFPNLVILTLVKQDIKRIEGLEACPFLIELWIIESQLTEIEGLECCTNLRRLYLYYNHINEIKNLESLEKLEILWLNNNNIKAIKGLNTLKHLKELNLAPNQCLVSIEHHFLTFVFNTLETDVFLLIYFFQELTNLSRLPLLQMLSLKDPQYNPNPISLLCNYSTHVIYHIPQLRWLDTYDVSSKQIKEFAESTVLKKIMYYNMRVKTIQQLMSDVLEKLQKQKSVSHRIPEERIKTISLCIKNVSTKEQQHDSNSVFVDGWDDATLEQKCCHKLDALRERLKVWNKKFDDYEKEVKQTMENHDFSIQYLLIELETVGNVRFEEGTPSDMWYSSCHDVISSRFCIWDFKTLGVTELKINRIVRVHNRILRLKYEEKIHALLNKDGTSNMSRNYKKLLEYLFYVFDPQHSSGMNEILHILEDGFKSGEAYKLLGRDEAVPLSNSISLCDYPRIEYLKFLMLVSGQIVIAKVFLGHSVQTQDSGMILQKNYPKTNSVYRPRKMEKPESTSTLKLHSGCDCSLRQYEWFIFDHELVVPEYVINFEYITPVCIISPASLNSRHAKAVDEEIVNMEPIMKPRPKVISLDEKTMLSIAKAAVLSQITVLSLHGNSLSKLKGISKLINLQKLTVSFNELVHLDDLSHLVHLEYVDVSHNHLVSLDGFKGMEKLKYLDLSWNQLTSLKEEIGILRKHSSGLVSLNLKHNPWQKVFFTSIIIILVLLLINSRTDKVQPRYLNLMSCAQMLTKFSKCKPNPSLEQNSSWLAKISTVNLDGQNISRITNLERLVNLRWASFNSNIIRKIEGLDRCLHLEELSLENNCITKLEGISKLGMLTRLNLGNNQLSNLEDSGLDRLPYLHHLSMENNQICSLRCFRKVNSIIELYLANNQINNNCEIYYLKVNITMYFYEQQNKTFLLLLMSLN